MALLSRRIPGWVDALWLALLTAYILAGAAIVPFHGDESTLIHLSQDYHVLFVEGDLSDILYDRNWPERAGDQRSRLIDGTISKFVYGWLAWNKGFQPADLNASWGWKHDYELNLSYNSVPDAQLLKAARMASAVQLALATVLLFQFVQMTLNRPTAYLASAFFVLHPNVLINGRRATMEGSHLLGLMLILIVGAWLLRERRWWAHALFGVCMGFAVAAKHPNIIACALVYLALLLATLRQQRRENGQVLKTVWRERAIFIVSPIVAALVFLLLNPAWWSAPWELPPVILDLRSALLKIQVNMFGGYNSTAERIQGFFQYVFAAEHQYFEVARWAGYDVISAQIQQYERSGLAGSLIGGTGLAGLLSLLLALFGLVKLARGSAIQASSRILLLVWILGSALVTLAVTPLPWARYYLPLAPALAILASLALVTLASSLWNRSNSRAAAKTIHSAHTK
ncbi:MAG: glycosyltransferase family 39 protein [Chloroflexi bacterium]|nr:glycosyltransferase family 39 protein [Chloroflexota bacterium]